MSELASLIHQVRKVCEGAWEFLKDAMLSALPRPEAYTDRGIVLTQVGLWDAEKPQASRFINGWRSWGSVPEGG